MSQSLIVRHLLPSAVSASAGVCASYCGFYLGKSFVTGLNVLPSAGLGVISGLSYSIMVETLTSKTLLKPLFIHTFSILTSAAATAGAAFLASSASLIAMPSLASLGLLIAAAVVCNMIYRSVFAGPNLPAPKGPQVAQLPAQPRPAQRQRESGQLYPKAGVIAIPPRNEVIKPWAAKAAEHPELWSWPADLQKIGMSENTRQSIDDFLREVVPQIAATNQLPQFLKKGDAYYIKKNEKCTINGRNFTLPRTLYFAVDPVTQRLSAILLNISKKNVSVLGKGTQRTVKVCYNLTSGRHVVKKAACSAYEVELLKALKDTKGFESLSQVRVTKHTHGDNKGSPKARLITPLYSGSLSKLLLSAPNLTAKDIKNLMVSYFNGLEKLHSVRGRTSFPDGKKYQLEYKSYHLDISPENLLYIRTSNGYDGVITDAGSVNDIPQIWYKHHWLSPEKDKLIQAERPSEENASFLAQHGQHDDLWNMGLILTSLLTGGYCHILSRKQARGLTQREVDAEIARQKPSAVFSLTMNRNAKAAMWEIARRLLQVDPKQRLTAAQARQEFERVAV